ncbi:BrxA family protein [Haladaptatus sp. GCM10025707]|uniref:BrxA family protein n=1 Tax=unclassified Haladaptatus TaxID=2622732 RepID=UPI0023E83B7F|nr:BrxA family protein [Haladaptatus sp. QDMS2]
MSTGRKGGLDSTLPSLNGTLRDGEASLDLNAAGILVDQTRDILNLYLEHGDWTTVEDVWLDERLSERSSRGSARRTFVVIKSRLKQAGGNLPSVQHLPAILDACRNDLDRRQVLYCYVVADDGLLRYVLHEYLRQLTSQSIDRLDFSDEYLYRLLDNFRFADGEPLGIADSTRKRWAKGCRSVLRQIGVITSKQGADAQVPTIGDVPLEIAAYWSWHERGDEWLTNPTGWRYLFQPESFWSPQSQRLARSTRWSSHEAHGRLWYEPVADFYAAFGEGTR